MKGFDLCEKQERLTDLVDKYPICSIERNFSNALIILMGDRILIGV